MPAGGTPFDLHRETLQWEQRAREWESIEEVMGRFLNECGFSGRRTYRFFYLGDRDLLIGITCRSCDRACARSHSIE